MTARETHVLAGQVLVAGFPGLTAPEQLLGSCTRGELGGIILFRRNLDTMHQISGLVAQFHAAAPKDFPLLVAVDQEGGRVARLGSPVVKLPAMRRLAQLGDVALVRRAASLLGRQLTALGFTMNLAPVLDVDTNPNNPVIGDRSFGSAPEQVIEQAFAFADGLSQGGVLTCGKHFPGHGDTDLDSHLALPRLPHDRARLSAVELAPFRAARGKVDAIMSAHVVFEAIRSDAPATLCREVIHDLLRVELGFEGCVLSDDLEMKAIADHYGIENAACLAIEAGCDALLVCSRLDWLARAQTALAERASRDSAFRKRLAEAAERFVQTRRKKPPTPISEPTALEQALCLDQRQQLEEELAARLAQIA